MVWERNPDNSYSQFIWTNGARQYISIPGTAINDVGQVTGGNHLWDNGIVTSLGSSGMGAADINNSGTVVGKTYVPSPPYWKAFMSENGQMTQLDLGTAYSDATGINNEGKIIGFKGAAQNSGNGYLWDNGTVTSFSTRPVAINDAGQVLFNASIWQDGTWSPLSHFTSTTDINDHGHVVGTKTLYDSWGMPYGWAGMLYQNGMYRNLDDFLPSGSGWHLPFPEAINDRGEIVGHGYYNGKPYAFLLTPIPEPSSFLVLGSGLAAFVGFMRRRR